MSKPPSPAELTARYARLMGEPWLYRPWEIERMTDRQIVDLIGHLRDEQGDLIVEPEPPDGPLSPEEEDAMFFAAGRALGVPVEQLEAIHRQKRGG